MHSLQGKNITTKWCLLIQQENETIILTLDPDLAYDRLDTRKMALSEKGQMYFQNEEVKRQFDLILEINCPFQGCKKSFNTVVLYKNHIKRDHRKFVWQEEIVPFLMTQ